jgi:alcohol dehydrogenase class IV
MESLWSIHATRESIAYSLEALDLIWKNIIEVVKNPDRRNREAMAVGAHIAGKAINISRTTAAHAISYTLTSNYKLAHGLAVMLTLGEILIYNYEVNEKNCNDPHGADYVKNKIMKAFKIFGSGDYKVVAEEIMQLPAKLGLCAKLNISNVDKKQAVDGIISQIDPNRLGNNPRKLTRQELVAIVEKIL